MVIIITPLVAQRAEALAIGNLGGQSKSNPFRDTNSIDVKIWLSVGSSCIDVSSTPISRSSRRSIWLSCRISLKVIILVQIQFKVEKKIFIFCVNWDNLIVFLKFLTKKANADYLKFLLIYKDSVHKFFLKVVMITIWTGSIPAMEIHINSLGSSHSTAYSMFYFVCIYSRKIHMGKLRSGHSTLGHSCRSTL